MDSIFTERSGNKDDPENKLDDFTKMFKGSLDILNSINEIS